LQFGHFDDDSFNFCFRYLTFFMRDASICIGRISYGNVAGAWVADSVAGWAAVCHSRYCIKTTKPILKLFRPSGSPIIEAFGNPCAATKFIGAIYTRGCEKLAIFDGNGRGNGAR